MIPIAHHGLHILALGPRGPAEDTADAPDFIAILAAQDDSSSTPPPAVSTEACLLAGMVMPAPPTLKALPILTAEPVRTAPPISTSDPAEPGPTEPTPAPTVALTAQLSNAAPLLLTPQRQPQPAPFVAVEIPAANASMPERTVATGEPALAITNPETPRRAAPGDAITRPVNGPGPLAFFAPTRMPVPTRTPTQPQQQRSRTVAPESTAAPAPILAKTVVPPEAFAPQNAAAGLSVARQTVDHPADQPTATHHPAMTLAPRAKEKYAQFQAFASQALPDQPPEVPAAPRQILSVQPLPVKTQRVQTLPFQRMPIQTLPEQTLPAQTRPFQTLPVQIPPAQTPTAQILPLQTPPVQTPPPQTQPIPTLPNQIPPRQITDAPPSPMPEQRTTSISPAESAWQTRLQLAAPHKTLPKPGIALRQPKVATAPRPADSQRPAASIASPVPDSADLTPFVPPTRLENVALMPHSDDGAKPPAPPAETAPPQQLAASTSARCTSAIAPNSTPAATAELPAALPDRTPLQPSVDQTPQQANPASPLPVPPHQPVQPQALPPALPATVPAQLIHHAAAATTGAVDVLLQPEELGHVKFQIQQHGETVRILLSAERPETLDLLRRHADQLLQEFRQSGFSQASLNFGQWGQQQRSPDPPRELATVVDAEFVEAPLPPRHAPAPAAAPSGQGLNLRL